jgi:hypothetical protein
MEKNIDINKFLFGRTKAEKKLEVINNLSVRDLFNVTDATILRIYKECHGDRDRFYLNSERRAKAGNNWNSNIEFIYEYNGRPCVCLYIQNSSTDSSITKSFAEFKRGGTWYGHIAGSYTYHTDDVARVIRGIIAEYVYWKYIEKAERERKERIAKVLDWRIYNPVCNQFYDEWRCKYESGGWRDTPNTDRYHRAEKAVKEYVEQHIDELAGKSVEELQAIYRRIFRETR